MHKGESFLRIFSKACYVSLSNKDVLYTGEIELIYANGDHIDKN